MADIHTVLQIGTASEVIEELVKPGTLESVLGPRLSYPIPLTGDIVFV